jgi:hypothetical protein
MIKNIFDNLYRKFLSPQTKERSEKAILWIALFSFIIHLVVITLVHFNIIFIDDSSHLLTNTILIRISFSVTGIINVVLIISAILFGLLMMVIHNKYEKDLANELKEIDEVSDSPEHNEVSANVYVQDTKRQNMILK